MVAVSEDVVTNAGCLTKDKKLDIQRLCNTLNIGMPVEWLHEDFLTRSAYYYDASKENIGFVTVKTCENN